MSWLIVSNVFKRSRNTASVGSFLILFGHQNYLLSDSSMLGRGALLGDPTSSGLRPQSPRLAHINVLEPIAVWLGLQSSSHSSQIHVAIMSDSMSTIAPWNVRLGSWYLSVGRESKDCHDSKTHSRTYECLGRLSQQGRSDPEIRMESESNGSKSTISILGKTQCRSVCCQTEYQIDNLHVSKCGEKSLETI